MAFSPRKGDAGLPTGLDFAPHGLRKKKNVVFRRVFYYNKRWTAPCATAFPRFLAGATADRRPADGGDETA